MPSYYGLMIARTLGMLKLVLILLILSGSNVLMQLGRAIPGWWIWCSENKIQSCMMSFFLFNALENYFLSSGAFEITFNDMPVWSKLETGRIPQPHELFQIIDSQLQFQGQPMQFEPGTLKHQLTR